MTKTLVVLVNYNGAKDTEDCIISLMGSTSVPDIVVVDNTPDDHELKSIVHKYPFVVSIQAPGNIGFGRGNNIGIKWGLERGYAYIFILNNDTKVLSDSIEVLEKSMEADPEVGIIAPRIVLSENPDLLWYGGGDVDYKRGSARVPGFKGDANSGIAMMERDVSFASGCAMFVRRSVFLKLGGFDPRFFMYEEDLELCLRASENNVRIKYVPSSVIHHVGQGSSIAENRKKFIGALHPDNPNLDFYAFHFTRNRLLNMSIHAKGINAFRFFCGYPVSFLYKFTHYAIKGRFGASYKMILGVFAFIQAINKDFENELM